MGSFIDQVGSLNFANTLNYIANVVDGQDGIDCYSNRMMIIFNYTFDISFIEVTSVCLRFEFCDTLKLSITVIPILTYWIFILETFFM